MAKRQPAKRAIAQERSEFKAVPSSTTSSAGNKATKTNNTANTSARSKQASVASVGDSVRDGGTALRLARQSEKRAQLKIALVTYREHGTIRSAALHSGLSRNTILWALSKFPHFKKAWDAAREDYVDSLEEALHRRAKKKGGIEMIFALKAERPAKYREEQHVKHSGKVDMSPEGFVTIAVELANQMKQDGVSRAIVQHAPNKALTNGPR